MMTPTQPRLVLGLVLMAVWLPSLILYSGMSFNLDTLWLCEGMVRLLHWQKMSDVAYDTNPPLSFLLYVVPALLQIATGVKAALWASVQNAILLAFASVVLSRLLSSFSVMTDARRFAAVTSFITGNLVLTGYYTGERDHLIGMMLVPLIVLQLAITNRLYQTSRVTRIFLPLALLMLLLKPHFLIIPLALWGHRIWKRRDLSIFKDQDIIAFGAVLFAYITVLLLFFRDFFAAILPDVLQYYVTPPIWALFVMQLSQMKIGIGSVLVLSGLSFVITDKDVRKIVLWLTFCTALGLIAALLQNKGFYYHLLPALLCLSTAAGLVVFETGCRFVAKREWVVCLASTVFCAGLMYLAVLTNPMAKGQGVYDPASPVVADILKATSGDVRKSFLLSAYGMQQIHEIAAYNNLTHASRFPAFWFLPRLVTQQQMSQQGLLSPEQETRYQTDFKRFGDMISADLTRFEPPIIVLLYAPMAKSGLPEVFAGHQGFEEAWSYYRLDHQINDPVTIPEQNIQYNRVFDVYLRAE